MNGQQRGLFRRDAEPPPATKDKNYTEEAQAPYGTGNPCRWRGSVSRCAFFYRVDGEGRSLAGGRRSVASTVRQDGSRLWFSGRSFRQCADDAVN